MSKTEKAYCLSCAREFHPASPDVFLCPDCGGPPEVTAPKPADSSQTLLEPNDFPSSPTRTLVEPAAERSFAESNVPAEWQPGDTLLDTYTVSDSLGEGGMGKVFRVHHKSWNIDLAVKSPRPEFFRTQEQRDLFVSEAETWVNLGLHPHIVSCYYVRTLGGIPRVFAELVEGGSLADWIEQGKITTVEKALDIAIQFAWGLAYAHEQGLVHRDVKPANVLMVPDGTVKVTDFGLANAGKGMTPAYASPEQAEAQLKNIVLTLRSDIWSWGLSILEMFAGRTFWVRADMPDYAWGQVAPQALEHFLSGELEEAAIAEMPVKLVELLESCFRPEPLTRPPGLNTIAKTLLEIFSHQTGKSYPRQRPESIDLRADSLNNKALSLMDLGQEKNALKIWEKALQLNANHPEVTYN
jgi:serine/threonine protein kinase